MKKETKELTRAQKTAAKVCPVFEDLNTDNDRDYQNIFIIKNGQRASSLPSDAYNLLKGNVTLCSVDELQETVEHCILEHINEFNPTDWKDFRATMFAIAASKSEDGSDITDNERNLIEAMLSCVESIFRDILANVAKNVASELWYGPVPDTLDK